MYKLGKQWYCATCFPKMVDIKMALDKLNEAKKS